MGVRLLIYLNGDWEERRIGNLGCYREWVMGGGEITDEVDLLVFCGIMK